MHLRALVFIAAIAYALVIGGGLMLYRVFVVIPELQQSALINHQDKITAIYSTYKAELESLAVLNYDWAAWNDTYHYVNGDNPAYEKENIDPYSFDDLDLNFVAVIGRDLKARFIGIANQDGITQLSTLTEATPDLTKDYLLSNQQLAGTLRVNGSIGYYSSHAITDNYEKQPSNGVLVFAKTFPKSFFERINLMTRTKTEVVPVKDITEPNAKIIHPEQGLTLERLHKTYYLVLDDKQSPFQTALKVSHDNIDLPFILDGTTIFSMLAFLALPIVVTFMVWLIFLRPVNLLFLQLKSMESKSRFIHIRTRTKVIEFRGFVKTFNKLVDKVHVYQEQLKQESQTDGLTGIRNRQYLDEEIEKMWRTSIRQTLPITIIMIDIDFFKKYNDLYGHQKGDDTLKLVAHSINKLARRSDDIVARYGGEEFMFVCRPDNTEELTERLESIMAAVRSLNIEHMDSSVSDCVTVSCGACHTASPKVQWHDAVKDAIKTADEALYEAKDGGRNRYVIRPFLGDR